MEKRIGFIIFNLVLLVLFNCSSSSKPFNKVDLETTKTFSEKKLLKFKAESALPMLTSDVMRVNNVLLSNRGDSPSRIMLEKGFYLKIKNDSISAVLPFYGEIRNVGYDTRTSGNINIKGISRNFSVKRHKNKTLIVEFSVKSEDDDYGVSLELFPSQKATLTLNGTHRAQIRYVGKVEFFENSDDLDLN